MNGRVGELAVRYRVPRGASLAAAHVPLLERAMQMGLAGQVATEIAAIDDPDGEVIVLREATARVTLRPSDWSLDRAMLERVSRAAREAVIGRLARPPGEDEMRRFASEAEFVGSFIVDLLDGSAWGRWYFGAFRRYRRAETRETLERLLAEAELDRGPLFAWLETRGRLGDLLRLVGPAYARPAIDSRERPGDTPPADLRPLAEAAFAILEALGVRVEPERETALVAEYYALHPNQPSWNDKTELTGWVWAFALWILAHRSRDAGTPRFTEPERRALHELLTGRLDWLDGVWLERQAAEWSVEPAQSAPIRTGPGPVLAPRHARLLARLAALVRARSVRFDRLGESRDQLVVRMIASLEAAGERDGLRDRAFAAALEQVCEAWQGAAGPPSHIATEPVVRELIAALKAATRSTVTGGRIETLGAGLYLLTRAVTDLSLVALAERAAVPAASVLGAIARKLLGLREPFDPAVAAWVGAEHPAFEGLEPEPLALLQDLVLERLRGQRHLDDEVRVVHELVWRNEAFTALSDPKGTCWPIVRARASDTEPESGENSSPHTPLQDLEALAPLDEVTPAIEVAVTSIASGVLRAWSRWIPGIGGSSMPFLVRTCLARGGCVRLDADLADVTLDPAPLDSVLEMAGYLKPMESARWLGRHVRFSIARSRR